jgi:hypothetical protein
MKAEVTIYMFLSIQQQGQLEGVFPLTISGLVSLSLICMV